jgi:TetR/AcrR family transcriptional regulator, transcriptional repressor for nem operon
MTDSDAVEVAHPQVRTGNKRERLVAAACRLFYEQGVEGTTLADISAAADVPLGNVYYYFKTKDELVKAAVDAQITFIEETTGSLDRHGSPAARLKALVKELAAQADMIAQYGCPQGSLCTELHKRSHGSDPASRRLLETSLAWAERQFQAMGRSDARDLAIEMIVRYQGTAVLTQALGDPSLMRSEARRIGRWIDSIAASSSATSSG